MAATDRCAAMMVPKCRVACGLDHRPEDNRAAPLSRFVRPSAAVDGNGRGTLAQTRDCRRGRAGCNETRYKGMVTTNKNSLGAVSFAEPHPLGRVWRDGKKARPWPRGGIVCSTALYGDGGGAVSPGGSAVRHRLRGSTCRPGVRRGAPGVCLRGDCIPSTREPAARRQS